MKKLTRLEILWIDAGQTTEWQQSDHVLSEDLLVKTIGYFWQEGKNYIAVIQSYTNDEGQIDAIMQIPKVCIKKIKKV